MILELDFIYWILCQQMNISNWHAFITRALFSNSYTDVYVEYCCQIVTMAFYIAIVKKLDQQLLNGFGHVLVTTKK